MKIPARCAELYQKGYGNKIIYTGGIGAGTADLNMPEADAFLDFTKKNYPHIPLEDIIIENRSTNTGENLRFTLSILQSKYEKIKEKFHKGKIILVANPFRQRRVFLTTAHILPEASLINCPPLSDYKNELALFKTKNENLSSQLPGEVQKIINYPDKGWIKRETVPEDIIKLAK